MPARSRPPPPAAASPSLPPPPPAGVALPAGRTARQRTQSPWSDSVWSQNPVSTSQNFTVWSRDAVTRNLEPAADGSTPDPDPPAAASAPGFAPPFSRYSAPAPGGTNRTADIVWSCPLSVRTHLYSWMSQILMLRSVEVLAKYAPRGLKSTQVTTFVCPFSVLRYSPDSWSHSLIVPSSLPLAAMVYTGCNATVVTTAEWDWRVCTAGGRGSILRSFPGMPPRPPAPPDSPVRCAWIFALVAN